MAAASLAAMTHLFLDVLSGGTLGLGWPLVDARAALPLVAMADPSLIAVFVLGAVAMWRDRQRLWRTARLVVIVIMMVFGVKAFLYGRVVHVLAQDARIQPNAPRAMEARWGSWTEWNVFEKDSDALRVWQAGRRTLTPLLSWPVAEESALIRTSRSLDTVRNFLSVHDITFAIERPQVAGQVEVLWSDVRYCRQDRPGAATIDCALWFGGVFDLDGRAIRQLIHVGSWTQQRRPSP